MSLTVLSVAYPFAAVGADAVGGAEQVLAQLDAALVEAGHRSIVVACEGSQVRGQLVPVEAVPGRIEDAQRHAAWATHRRRIEQVLDANAVDVVHMHGIDFHACLPARAAPPVLATLHLPPAWYAAATFDALPPHVHLHCVSRSQRRACPPGARVLDEVIENGVSPRLLGARCRKRGYALCLARICPEKNVHAALDAGRRARVPVLLGGQVFPYEAHERYFRDEVAPRLDRHRRFVGPLPLARKRRLLAGARCLLLPTLAPETSSLVAMEALASGTPVIAYPSGALPEIVEHGVTGFLVRSVEEMAEAIAACDAIDAERCRAVARARFDARSAAQRYLQLYERLARGDLAR